MEITSLELKTIDYSNNEHLTFLKKLMKSSNMSYLWNLADPGLASNKLGNNYIVLKGTEKLGYLGISDITEAVNGRTVSIYYAILEEFRGQKYGEQLVKVLSNHLLGTGKVDCIVAQVDINNTASQHVLMNNGYQVIYQDTEDMKFMQTRKAHM